MLYFDISERCKNLCKEKQMIYNLFMIVFLIVNKQESICETRKGPNRSPIRRGD